MRSVEIVRCDFENHGLPVTTAAGQVSVLLRNDASLGSGMVKITPALVPAHNASPHVANDVMRRHAIL